MADITDWGLSDVFSYSMLIVAPGEARYKLAGAFGVGIELTKAGDYALIPVRYRRSTIPEERRNQLAAEYHLTTATLERRPLPVLYICV